MPRQTIHTLLAQAREFHRSLHTIYSGLEHLAHKERVKELLDDLARHEDMLEASLEAVEDDLSLDVLNSWIDNVPPESAWHAVRKIRFRPDMSFEEVGDMATTAEQYLVELYREVCALPLPEAVHEIFAELLREARTDRDQLAFEVREIGGDEEDEANDMLL